MKSARIFFAGTSLVVLSLAPAPTHGESGVADTHPQCGLLDFHRSPYPDQLAAWREACAAGHAVYLFNTNQMAKCTSVGERRPNIQPIPTPAHETDPIPFCFTQNKAVSAFQSAPLSETTRNEMEALRAIAEAQFQTTREALDARRPAAERGLSKSRLHTVFHYDEASHDYRVSGPPDTLQRVRTAEENTASFVLGDQRAVFSLLGVVRDELYDAYSPVYFSAYGRKALQLRGFFLGLPDVQTRLADVLGDPAPEVFIWTALSDNSLLSIVEMETGHLPLPDPVEASRADK